MMNEQSIVKLMTPLTNDNGDGLYTHAPLPGLFRAIVVKLNNKNNKYDDDNNNCNNHHQKREDRITSKYGTRQSAAPNCDCRKVHLKSSNLSIGDILLIANDSHETISANRTRPDVCPAYRFCVERNTATNMVTMDQEDSIISSEVSYYFK